MDADLVRDFINRYEQGDPTQGYSEEEARDAFERAAQVASPEVLQQATGQAIERLDDGQRAEFDQLMRTQGQPSTGGLQAEGMGFDTLLSGLFGGEGLGSMLRQFTSPGQADGRSGPAASPLGNLGPLLASPVGRAVIGGIGAFALKEMLRSRR